MTVTSGGSRVRFTPGGVPDTSGEAEALIGEARARQRQRRLRLIVVAVVLVAVGGGIYGGIGGGDGHAATVNSVERGLADALSRAKTTLILSSVQDQPQHQLADFATLIDLSTGTSLLRTSFGPARQAIGSYYSTAPGSSLLSVHLVTVDYWNRTWRSKTQRIKLTPSLRAALRPAALCQCDPLQTTQPNEIDLHVTLLNDQTIDGQPTFHLRFTWAVARSSVASTRVDLWINTSTFLPIRETTSTTSSRNAITEGYSWLPRTPTNIAKLRVVVPPGFTHQPSP